MNSSFGAYSELNKQLNEEFNDNKIVKDLTLTEEEEGIYIRNNKNFSRMLMGVIQKFKGELPYSIKRMINKIYRGNVSLRYELENYKKSGMD